MSAEGVPPIQVVILFRCTRCGQTAEHTGGCKGCGASWHLGHAFDACIRTAPRLLNNACDLSRMDCLNISQENAWTMVFDRGERQDDVRRAVGILVGDDEEARARLLALMNELNPTGEQL